MKGFLKGVFSVVYLVFAVKLGIKIFNGLLPFFYNLFDSADMNSPAMCSVWAGLVTLVYAGVALALLVCLLPSDNKKNSSPKSTPAQTQRPVQTQAPRPTAAAHTTTAARPVTTAHTAAARPTATQTVRPAQPQTARPAATQSRPVQTQAAKPAAQRTKTVNATSKNIPVDYAKAIPGALKGLLGGFALCLVFGFLASLTSGSSITNLFTPLAGLSLIVCPIIGYINALHDQPGQRKLKADEQAHAANLEKSLKEALDILNQGCGVTQESISRYDTACDNLVFLIAWNYFDSRYKHIIMPYYNAVYERTWPVFNWRNGKYEVAIGEELSDRLHNEIEKKVKEWQEKHERKMRQY